MIHFISSNKGGRFTRALISNTVSLTYFLLSVTDQTSGYFCIITMTENSMTGTENLLYFTVPPANM